MSLDDRIREAQHRIEELWYETGGKCYLSYSGGKDSTVILALIKMCEEIYTIPVGGVPAVFSDTGIEMGITIDFVRWVKESYYSNVQIIRPDVSFDWVIKNKGKPMMSKLKSHTLHQYKTTRPPSSVSMLIEKKTLSGKPAWKTSIPDMYMHMISDDFKIMPSEMCCDYMKKKPFKKYEAENDMKGTFSGIRINEGGVRELDAKRRVINGGKLCTYSKHGVIYKLPIIDWSDEDVEEFVEKYNVPLSDAYTKYGFDRTGCMACPFAKRIEYNLKYLYEHEPNRYKAAMHWLQDVYIAQNVVLPFDEAYERERVRMWRTTYEPMRQEMLRKYRPNSRLIKQAEQLSLFDEE